MDKPAVEEIYCPMCNTRLQVLKSMPLGTVNCPNCKAQFCRGCNL